MSNIVETFDAISIKNSSVQMHNSDGTKEDGTKFGCVGSMSGETTLRELIKRCEGVEVKKRTKPEKLDLTVSAHVPVAVLRDLFGLSNDDLKPGVYAYSTDAKGKEFTYTADVMDEFEDITKLIAFPRCISATGFKFSVENGADEVAEMELQLTAYPDKKNKFYYEALVNELDEELQDEWHKNFTYELVEAIPTP
ncbi:phage tail protein [Evansella clarkii]|uniref:phage tail protein n=1 Tax=Evansella clarkii TaxID=79879 RepID=UPI000B44F085|nr:phage tail protein [Evansella clarkii]